MLEVQLSDIDFTIFKGQQVKDAIVQNQMPRIRLNNGELYFECFWRLRNKNRIIVGCEERKTENHRNSVDAQEELIKQVSKRRISNIYHIEATSDLIVEFDRELFLDLICDSSIFESWELRVSGKLFLVSTPGGHY